jgi:hypothetical protein
MDIAKINITLKIGLVLIYIASIMGLSFLYVNISHPDKEINDWKFAANRGFHNMPCDNDLQFATAKVFLKHRQPWKRRSKRGQWTMGDRPPLMAVVYSIYSKLLRSNCFWRYQIVGTILNSLFFLPLFLLSCRLFRKINIAFYLSISVLLNCFIFLNIYYTWPKLFGVFFSLLSIALIVYNKENYFTIPIHGSLWGLSALCHGAVLLSIPAFLIFYFLKRYKQIKLHIVLYAIIFFIFFFLIQSPWIMYKKQHPDINTYRLVYKYLPKDYRPKYFSSKNTKEAFLLFFNNVSFKTQIKRRLNNIKDVLLKRNNLSNTIKSLSNGSNWDDHFKDLYKKEFFYPITAIGELPILLSLITIIYYLILCLKVKHKIINFNNKSILFLATIIIFSYIFNIFLKWEIAVNHELPYLELIIAIVITSGIAISSNAIVRLILLTFIFLRFSYYIIFASLINYFQVFDFFNIIIFLCILFLFCLAAYFKNYENDIDLSSHITE